LLAFAAAAAAQPAKKVLRIHTAGPNDTNVDNTKLAVEFAENANKAASTLDVRVFPASQLGQTREVIEAMRLGSGAAGTTGGPAEYASFVKRLGVLGLPFEWKSYEHALAVLDGPVGKELDQDMERAGFKVLSWAVSWGFRNVVTAKKEVKQPADLKGLKIRTIPTKVFVAAINSMGANATPMNFGEIYTSLQSGAAEGRDRRRQGGAPDGAAARRRSARAGQEARDEGERDRHCAAGEGGHRGAGRAGEGVRSGEAPRADQKNALI
jgi:TRAP-type C4-dicarboxylate transport system substrate-binding protein